MGMEIFNSNSKKSVSKQLTELQKTIDKLNAQKNAIEVKIETKPEIHKVEQEEVVQKPETPKKKPKETVEKESTKEDIEKRPILNKVRSMNLWKKTLLTGAFGLSSLLATVGFANKNKASAETRSIDTRIESVLEQEISPKIDTFNQVAEFVDTNYYRSLEKTKNYTAELNYLKRADTLEKGGIIGKNVVMSPSKTGTGYDAYYIDNENRVVDSTLNIPADSAKYAKYELNNIGGDILIQDTNSVKNVEDVLGVHMPEKLKAYLEPIKTWEQKGGEVQNLPTHVTVTPKKQVMGGKVAIIGDVVEGDFTASPVTYVTPEKFKKQIGNIVDKKMPSRFTLFKDAIVGGESGGDYEIECTVGNACGKYQIIPSWHFFRTGLDEDSKKDRTFFISHPSVQDLTYRLYYKALIDKHDDDFILAVADYAHGQEAVNAVKQDRKNGNTYLEDNLRDPLGTSVGSYIRSFSKKMSSGIKLAQKNLKSPSGKTTDNALVENENIKDPQIHS